MTFEERYAAARRQAIARDFRRLYAAQPAGARTTVAPPLLLAGAGGGGTAALRERV